MRPCSGLGKEAGAPAANNSQQLPEVSRGLKGPLDTIRMVNTVRYQREYEQPGAALFLGLDYVNQDLNDDLHIKKGYAWRRNE
jgi:hypothetical protein